MSKGRPILGPALVENVDGSALAKERLTTILQTIAGECTVVEACARLGVSEARFHALRAELLQVAATHLEPKPVGRPVAPVSPEAEKVATLERQVQELKVDLRAAQIREELALLMPHVLQPRTVEGDRRQRLDALQSLEKKATNPHRPSSGATNATPSNSGTSGKS
jgi:hypothetical protein